MLVEKCYLWFKFTVYILFPISYFWLKTNLLSSTNIFSYIIKKGNIPLPVIIPEPRQRLEYNGL